MFCIILYARFYFFTSFVFFSPQAYISFYARCYIIGLVNRSLCFLVSLGVGYEFFKSLIDEFITKFGKTESSRKNFS